MMGSKEFLTIKIDFFRFYTQYSILPLFHKDGINEMALKAV